MVGHIKEAAKAINILQCSEPYLRNIRHLDQTGSKQRMLYPVDIFEIMNTLDFLNW